MMTINSNDFNNGNEDYLPFDLSDPYEEKLKLEKMHLIPRRKNEKQFIFDGKKAFNEENVYGEINKLKEIPIPEEVQRAYDEVETQRIKFEIVVYCIIQALLMVEDVEEFKSIEELLEAAKKEFAQLKAMKEQLGII